jgi:hypothetical protein
MSSVNVLKAVKILRGSDEYLIADGHRTGQGQTVQFVCCEDLEGRSGFHDRCRAALGDAIDLAVRQQRRSAVSAEIEPLRLIPFPVSASTA